MCETEKSRNIYPYCLTDNVCIELNIETYVFSVNFNFDIVDTRIGSLCLFVVMKTRSFQSDSFFCIDKICSELYMCMHTYTYIHVQIYIHLC